MRALSETAQRRRVDRTSVSASFAPGQYLLYAKAADRFRRGTRGDSAVLSPVLYWLVTPAAPILTGTRKTHACFNTTASGHGRQVQQRPVLRIQRKPPDPRQSARFRTGEDAQPAQRHDDGTPLLIGRSH